MNIILYISLISLFLVISTSIYELYVFNNAPFLNKNEKGTKLNTSLSIIIPAYNEEENIKKCLKALSEIKIPCDDFEILVVDDLSNDDTIRNFEQCKREFFNDKFNLSIISAGKRPSDKKWFGKNWACYKGSKKVDSEWLLFIDADVILEKYCIFNALSKSYTEEIDLLSLAPRVNCNCFAEWLVQPIMTSLLMIGFPISDTNNPKSKIAFAAGPFMLFKKESYEKIGGHKETYDEIVEDLALASKIKKNNLKLKFLIAIEDISLNMYKDFESLIEGWSKNWFLGLEENFFKSLTATIFVFMIHSAPWLILLLTSYSYLFRSISSSTIYILFYSLMTIIFYGLKRYWLNYKFKLSNKFWFLNGIGGFVVLYISLISIYKTKTGNKWTWKGRKLT